MRFAVESWSPDYGRPVDEDALLAGTAEVDVTVEVPVAEWAPVAPPVGTEPLPDVLFVDGVRRVEAHVWITDAAGDVHQGICASYAAGAVRCNGTADLVDTRVERGLFCLASTAAAPIRTRHATFGLHVPEPGAAEDLSQLLQRCMGDLEARVTRSARETAELILVDGPLPSGGAWPGAEVGMVGYVKTHRAAYGPPVVRETVARLAVGERTPLLRIGEFQPRFTWYLRLPGPHRHGWAGVVRLEAPAAPGIAAAVTVADRLAVSLGRYASAEQKDPRAPQNLYPIGGLERELRRRLGDPALLYRALREAAGA